MRTKTVILYEYNELSGEAKEKVRQWYLDDPARYDILSEDFTEQFVAYFFPDSNLQVQWSLNCCQGDGVNIYGELDLNDILNYIALWNPEEHSFYNRAFDPRNLLTAKERRRLLFYIGRSGRDAALSRNWHYTYCLADQLDFATEMIEDLEEEQIRDIDKDLIRRFREIVVMLIHSLCDEMEQYGYDFLYEVDDEEIADACAANDWTFLADGTFEVA